VTKLEFFDNAPKTRHSRKEEASTGQRNSIESETPEKTSEEESMSPYYGRYSNFGWRSQQESITA